MTKVRIYDLSKELHLENREILQICEQLNIPFKSHSSTISESDAERIKAMAAKYTPAKPASKTQLKSPEPVKKERKQQILAIHHKQAPTSPRGERQTATLAPPPRAPVQPQLLSPPTSPAPEKRPAPPREAVPSPEPTPPQDGQGQPAAPKLEAPQLLKPPVKGEREAATETTEQPPTRAAVSAAPEAPTPGKRLPKKPAKLEGSLPTPPAKATPKLELRPPQPPRPPGKISPEEAEKAPEEEVELLEGEITETGVRKPAKKQKLTLHRPTPPRPSKKKISEEEEEREVTGKATKGAGKGKRRQQTLLEEDEDFDLELESVALSSSVSLSVARPPKPKSMAQPQPTAATAKPKKAPVKADSSGVRSKGERRERAELQKRPETIVLTDSLTVRELADLLKIPETDIIKDLFFKGIPVQITQTLDIETARLVAEELGVAVETAAEKAAATKVTEMLDAADLENLQRRPPVVTIMGHVDHGKTTLLDSIRQTKVAQGEAGGITQHIGAYHVDVEHNGQPEKIVFLDTPGHEAFTAMRARGARVTDIAILVVAADDGVQPQTREAISHARAAEVPIVVAINKIDKPDANPDRIKQELSELELVPEEWGGDTIMVPVSALKGENLDSLLEMVLLVADLEEMSANPDRSARGTVIEAHLDRTRGPVATLLVQNGTLRVGDVIVAGAVFGKIRAMIDDRGERVETATPSFAVEVLGLNDVPAAGDEFEVLENEKEARTIAEGRAEDKRQSRLQQAMASRRVTLTTLSAQAQEGELKELNLILKADVQGSVEAILGALQQLPQNEVQIRVLLAAPGEITETDVDLAAASGAVIIGFSTTLASGARQLADQQGVDIREYDIIYKLLDDVQGAMEGLLEPEEIESPLGQAEVRAVFPVGRGSVAGCYVQSGKLVRNRYLRVRRQGEVIYQGTLDSLKRMKEDVREVSAGFECGIGISKFNNWQEGDIIEAYEMVSKRRTLSPN